MPYSVVHVYCRMTPSFLTVMRSIEDWPELTYAVPTANGDPLAVVRFHEYGMDSLDDCVVYGDWPDVDPKDVDLPTPEEATAAVGAAGVEYYPKLWPSFGFLATLHRIALQHGITPAHYFSFYSGGSLEIQCAWILGANPEFIIEGEDLVRLIYRRGQGVSRMEGPLLGYMSERLGIGRLEFAHNVHYWRFDWRPYRVRVGGA